MDLPVAMDKDSAVEQEETRLFADDVMGCRERPRGNEKCDAMRFDE